MADIVYDFEGGLYFNLTNECPCKCVFCVRDKKDSVVDGGTPLWHDKTPDFDDIKKAIDSTDMSKYTTAVFCGYGEPTCAFENLKKTAKYLKDKYSMTIRLNTNGLGSLVNGRDITDELVGLVDSVSVSLNAPTAEQYLKITRNEFGIDSFDAMLDFTKKCTEKGIKARMTVVDIIKKEEIEQCAEIAKNVGATFDARVYITE